MIPWWAVLYFLQSVALVGAFAILYGLLLRRLATVAGPRRLELAERGEKYLAFCDNQREIQQVNFYLDNAFNPWIAVIACIFLWVGLLIVLLNPRAGALETKNEDEHEAISNLFTISVFAANPLFGMIVAIEIIVFTIVALLLVGNVALIRRAVTRMLEGQARRSGRRIHAH